MIKFEQVKKGFGTQDVLNGVDFVIQSGWHVGIIGPNGAGKSTIFELIAGNIAPDTGYVLLPGDPRIGYVRQQLYSAKEEAESLIKFTECAVPAVVEIIEKIHAIEARLHHVEVQERRQLLQALGNLQTKFELLGGYDLKTRAEAALSGLGFESSDFGRPFSSFSGGWQMRAELARNLIADPDILLLDEPTNYLDIPAIEWLYEYLTGFAGTMLLISHDRYLLNLLTKHIIEINSGETSVYKGNYNIFLQQRQQRREQLMAAKQNLDRKKEQIDRFIERFRAKNTKASQVQSRIKLRERMEDITVPEEQAVTKLYLPPVQRSGDMVLKLRDAGFFYKPDEWIFRGLNLDIERGQKLAVVGLNGTGKTTLLRTIAGEMHLSEGERQVGASVSLGYMSQDFAEVMDPELTVFETARGGAAPERTDSDVRSVLGGLGFSGDAVDKKVQVLSGGEKIRLSLARLLLKSCNFLVLDEPTTHLDIGMREALQNALQNYDGTICFVSHDIEFLRETANEIMAITRDGIRLFRGGYDYYHQKRLELSAETADGVTVESESSGKESRRLQKQREALRRKELYSRRKPLEKEIAATERSVGELEEEQQKLVEKMQTNPSSEEYEAINRRLAAIQPEIESLTELWEKLSLELDELVESL